KNLHRRVAWIVAYKLLVDFEDAFQLAIENLAGDVRQVKIDHGFAIDAEIVFVDDFEDRAGRASSRDEVAVLRIPLFEEVPTLALRDRLWIALVAGSLRYPDASALAARRFRHQSELVLTGNRSGVNLNEFAVGVVTALLVKRGLRRAGTDDRIGRFS